MREVRRKFRAFNSREARRKFGDFTSREARRKFRDFTSAGLADFSFIYGWLGPNFLLYTADQRHGKGRFFFRYGWPRPGPAFFLYTSGQGQLFKEYTASQGTGQGHFFFTYGWPGPKILLYTVAVLKLSNGLGQLWHVQYTFITFFLYTIFLYTIFSICFHTTSVGRHAGPSFFYILSYYLCWTLAGAGPNIKKNFPVLFSFVLITSGSRQRRVIQS